MRFFGKHRQVPFIDFSDIRTAAQHIPSKPNSIPTHPSDIITVLQISDSLFVSVHRL